MLKLQSTLISTPVLSLRTGGPVARTEKIILNPNNLKILGWYVTDRFNGEQMVLLANDVRDISPKGVIINDHEVLSEVEDLVRLKKIIEIDFDPMGKKIVDRSGRKYGKVTDYAVETSGLFIKKLYSSQSVLRSLTGGSHSIDRNQIYEITNQKIIINDSTEKAKATVTSLSPAS